MRKIKNYTPKKDSEYEFRHHQHQLKQIQIPTFSTQELHFINSVIIVLKYALNTLEQHNTSCTTQNVN